MELVCSGCGRSMRPGAQFCTACGCPTASTAAPGAPIQDSLPRQRDKEPVAPPRPAARVSKGRIVVIAVAAVIVVAAVVTAVVLYRRSGNEPQPTKTTTEAVAEAPAAPVSQLPAVDVEPKEKLAQEYETLQKQADDVTKKLGVTLDAYKKATNNKLPPSFGADLTDEQRALLEQRIQQERASTRTLLQDVLDRDKQIKALRARAQEISTQLPTGVVVKDGDRHDRLAVDYLTKRGVTLEQAYALVNSLNLKETLLPGFKVWMFYEKGQFGTWVTQGSAGISPQEHEKRLSKFLVEERDAAVKEKNRLAEVNRELEAANKATTEDLKTTAAAQEAAERRIREMSAFRYSVGTKKDLVSARNISKDMRLRLLDGLDVMSLADPKATPTVSIDAAQWGLTKVKKVTLLPELFVPGTDFDTSIAGTVVTIRLRNPGKFSGQHGVVVLE
jgi:hypothetical protein